MKQREIPFFLFTACTRRNGLTLQQGRFRLDVITRKDGKVLEQIIGEQKLHYYLQEQPT